MTGPTDDQPLSGRRVLVVASYDSFLKSATRYADMLSARGAEVDYVLALARPRQISRAQREAMGFGESIPLRTIDTLVDPEYLRGYDVCLLSLDGQRTREFTARFRERMHDGPRRPITVSFYPGLIFRFHLEGWCSRASLDLVLLNSPADQAWYRELLKGAGIERDNSLCAGLSLLPSLAHGITPVHRPDGDIVFMGQPTVPSGRVERAYVVAQLVRLARRHPTRRFLLKPRHRPGETTLHRTRYHYADLLRSRAEEVPNLQLTYEPVDAVLASTALCLTYSSTAALEAVALGIPTRVLTDFGIHENIGNHFFLGSDLLADLSDVTPDLEFRLNRDWFERHARSATDAADAICHRVGSLLREQDHLGRALPPTDERLFARSPAFEAFRQDSHQPPWQLGEPSGWARRSARLAAIATHAYGLATRRLPLRRARRG